MKLAAIGARIRASMIAAVTGWAAAMAVTLPMQFTKIYMSALGGRRALLWSLGAGTAVWCAWSLIIAAAAWLWGGLPLIAIVRERWLLRHRRTAVVVSGTLGWLVVLLRFKVWDLLLPEARLEMRIFTLYTLLLVIFTSVATAVYLRRVARLRG